MGAKIVKLINEDSSVEDEPEFDLEQGGENVSTSSDSSLSTSDDDYEYADENCTSEYKPSMNFRPNDPYIVEKRFVAGSNEYYYNIVKRK